MHSKFIDIFDMGDFCHIFLYREVLKFWSILIKRKENHFYLVFT